MMIFGDHIHGICENMMLNTFPITFERHFTLFRQKRTSKDRQDRENSKFRFCVNGTIF